MSAPTMKPKPTPQPAALPRARVTTTLWSKAKGYHAPAVLTNYPTLAAAKRAAKWDNLSDQEKVALAERTFWNHRGNVLDSLRAVLKLTRDLQ